MAETFASLVAGAGWRAQAEAWATGRLAELGLAVTGPIEQPRVRPWSTQLVLPTAAGRVWFKANCRALAFEPGLHAALARLDPDEVDQPLAVDTERGWILTPDRGATLGASHEPTLEDWRAVLALAAGLQRRVAEHGADLLGAGLPDCAPHTVPARYDAMTARLAALPPEHPSHLTETARAELQAGRSAVEEAVAVLQASPLPATLQHGDLHPGNVFAVAGGLRIFDFGDAQWAHALEVLAVPWGWVTRLTELPWPRVLDAYADVWADLLDREALERLMSAAMVTHAVNRSFTWAGAIAESSIVEAAEWADAPVHYLRLALEPFPP
jgi:Phosphotransferase enzyme family